MITLFGETHRSNGLLEVYRDIFFQAGRQGCRTCFIESEAIYQSEVDERLEELRRLSPEQALDTINRAIQNYNASIEWRSRFKEECVFTLAALNDIRFVCVDASPFSIRTWLVDAMGEHFGKIDFSYMKDIFADADRMHDLIANDTHLSIEEVAVAMRVIEREIENEQEFRQNHLNDLRDRMKGDAKIASRIHSCPDCDNAMVLFGAHHMDIHRRNALPNVLAETYGLDVSVYIIKDDKILARPGALRGGGSALVPQERLSEGVAPDEQEPLLRDAVQGDPESQYSLAKHFGLKAPQDRTEMIWWLSQSASHGHAEALYQLAMVYGDPLSLDLDEVKAFPLALRAATLGHVYSQVLVGKYYYEAVGTTKDDALSHMWYLRAAQAGDSVAQSVVGYNYLVGCGVGLDHVEARRWLEAAAAQGDQDALRNTRYLKDRI